MPEQIHKQITQPQFSLSEEILRIKNNILQLDDQNQESHSPKEMLGELFDQKKCIAFDFDNFQISLIALPEERKIMLRSSIGNSDQLLFESRLYKHERRVFKEIKDLMHEVSTLVKGKVTSFLQSITGLESKLNTVGPYTYKKGGQVELVINVPNDVNYNNIYNKVMKFIVEHKKHTDKERWLVHNFRTATLDYYVPNLTYELFPSLTPKELVWTKEMLDAVENMPKEDEKQNMPESSELDLVLAELKPFEGIPVSSQDEENLQAWNDLKKEEEQYTLKEQPIRDIILNNFKDAADAAKYLVKKLFRGRF